MLKAAVAILLLAALLVLVGMNFLVVSNVGDRLRALQSDVDQLKLRSGTDAAGAPGSAAGSASFDLETAPLGGEGSGEAQLVTLADRPLREAVVALTETVDAEGARTPVTANAVVLVPGVPGQIPVGRETGCVPAAGATTGSWVLTLEGAALRVSSRSCAYARPVRGRLRGVLIR